MSYWRIAGSPVLACSITNERLATAGHFTILPLRVLVLMRLNRRVPVGTHGGVRGRLSYLFRDAPHNCAQTIHVIPADQNFEKKRNSSALFAREINLVTQPSFDCEQGINSQVQTACSNTDAVFPVLGIVFCKNERFSLSRKTHVQLWNEPRISHVRLL